MLSVSCKKKTKFLIQSKVKVKKTKLFPTQSLMLYR